MLYVRYDWRRPLFWSALLLVLFLSSQKEARKEEEIEVYGLVSTEKNTKHTDEQGIGRNTSYNNFSLHLFITK